MLELTCLQRRILAVLEEPGGYNVPVLTNTVAHPHGEPSEMRAMSIALIGLISDGLVQVEILEWARWSYRPPPLPREDAIKCLTDLHVSAVWSAGRGQWEWRDSSRVPEVVLTDAGMRVAHAILSEEGWPVRKLDTYE
jgi:hypothetical protein